MKNLYVDIHVIQDIPPANLNRDDSGSPKNARYGGVDRLRVSSQAWKRATRTEFAQRMPLEELGLRTRRLDHAVSEALIASGIPEEKASVFAPLLVKQTGIKAGKKPMKLLTYCFSLVLNLKHLLRPSKKMRNSGMILQP